MRFKEIENSRKLAVKNPAAPRWVKVMNVTYLPYTVGDRPGSKLHLSGSPGWVIRLVADLLS
jgi:hypothetical protein